MKRRIGAIVCFLACGLFAALAAINCGGKTSTAEGLQIGVVFLGLSVICARYAVLLDNSPPGAFFRFTWPTLIVWFFFISFPALVIWPVYQGSRPVSPATICRANLNQLGLAIVMYSNDFDGKAPLAPTWRTATDPYIKSDLKCPEAGNVFGYGFNRALSGIVLEHADLKTAMAFDMNGRERNAHGGAKNFVYRHHDTGCVVHADGTAKRYRLDEPAPRWKP